MDDKIHNRISGAILGSACANTIGGSGIGLNHKDLLASFDNVLPSNFQSGLAKSYLPDHKPGDILSDTYLAIVLAESIISQKGKLNIADLKKRYADLLQDEAFLASAPGAPCLSGLRRMADGLPPVADGSIESTHLNGAVRAYILGCLPDKIDHNKLASQQAQLTQGDSRVWAASAVMADSVAQLVRGVRLDSAAQVRDYVSQEFKLATQIDARFAEAWDDVAPDLNYQQPATELPYSLVNVQPNICEAIPTSVGIFLIFRHDLEAAINHAALSGGNTDSVTAIVGALSGAYHGASALPKAWLDKLSQRKRLEAVIEGLVNLW